MFRKIYYAIVNAIARLVFKKRKVVLQEGVELCDEPAVFVSNHSGILGPVVLQKYLKVPKRIWVTSGMVSKENSVNYFFHDMLVGRASKNKKKTRKTAKLMVSLVQPLLNKNDRFIVVNKSSKNLMTTFKQSIQTLEQGKNLVIFPEKHKRYGKFINSFHNGFVNVAKLWHNKTGKSLKFYPVYVGADLKTINIGEPVCYDATNEKKIEAERICNVLQERIEKIGESLPKHKTIPYVPQTFYDFYGEYEDDEIGFFNFVNQPYSE